MTIPDLRQRVLVVDDEPSMVKLIQHVLKNEERDRVHDTLVHPGFFVGVADDGDVAIEMVTNGWNPDLILMDLMMPRLPGILAIRQIKLNPETANIPIIAMSAGHNLKRLQIPEADSLLAKPFDIDNLTLQCRFWANRSKRLR